MDTWGRSRLEVTPELYCVMPARTSCFWVLEEAQSDSEIFVLGVLCRGPLSMTAVGWEHAQGRPAFLGAKEDEDESPSVGGRLPAP